MVTLTRFGCHLRFTWRWEWETLCPVSAFFPVIGQTLVISDSFAHYPVRCAFHLLPLTRKQRQR